MARLAAAHLDAACDARLISFTKDGSLVIPPGLAQYDVDFLGLLHLPPLQGLRHKHEPYLKHHRDNVFQVRIGD